MSLAISNLPSRVTLPVDPQVSSVASGTRHAILDFLNRNDATGLLAYLNGYASLDCSGIRLTADHVAVIKTVLSNPKLLITEINLAGTMIGKVHALSIAETIQANSKLRIHSINFSACDLNDNGTNAVINALKHNNSLKEINLDDNHIGPDCVPALVEMLHYGSIKMLEVNGDTPTGLA